MLCLYSVVDENCDGSFLFGLVFFLFKGHPSPEPGKTCGALNPGKGAKWENWECDKKLGYICKRGNATLESFIIPRGRFGNKSSTNSL